MEGGLNKDEEERIFKQIEGLIKYHQKIFIFHHIRPDGDCLGSQFGLKELILTNFKGKKVKAIGDSKNQHSYLELKHDLRPTLEEIKDSLAIIVDSNYLERVEEADLIKSGLFKDIIRIDHHSNQDDLPGRVLRYVDPSFSACAEQVSYLAKELN